MSADQRGGGDSLINPSTMYLENSSKGLPSLELASYASALQFNDGASAILKVMGGEYGTFAMETATKKDLKRVREMEYKAKPDVKKSLSLRDIRTRGEEQNRTEQWQLKG